MSKRLTEGEIERLRALIRGMSRDSAIYRLLRDELGTLGYWKAQPRGNPRAGMAAAKSASSSA